MRIRSVLKWMLFLIVLIVVGLSGTAWWFWDRSDEMLRETILEKIAVVAPELDLTLEEAEFDWQNQSKVYLTDIRIRPAGDPETVLSIPKAVLFLDPDLLKENMQIVLRKVQIQDAHLNLVRDALGEWNYERLGKFVGTSDSKLGFPELTLGQLSVSVRIEHEQTSLGTHFTVEQANVRCIPRGEKVYDISGSADIQRAGQLSLQGKWDLLHSQWELSGRMENLPAGQPLLNLMTDVAPSSHEKLVRVENRMRSLLPGAEPEQSITFAQALEQSSGDPFLLDPYSEQNSVGSVIPVSYATATATEQDVPDFGLTGPMRLNFNLSQAGADAEIDYKILVHLKNGQLDNPLLPFPLRELEAKLYVDRHQILLRDFSGFNGDTRVTASGNAMIHGLSTPGTIEAKIENLPITSRLKKIINPSLQKVYDELNPSGVMDFEGVFQYDGFGGWSQEQIKYSFRHGSVLPAKFPYPINEIHGTVIPQVVDEQTTIFHYQFEGLAGRQPITFSGWGRPGDEGGESLFDIHCDSLPLDETFVAACSPQAQKALQLMNLHGTGKLDLRLFRPSGDEKKFSHKLEIAIREGSIEYDRFPYPVKEITGKVDYNSEDDVWAFRDIKGVHGDARLSASGTFSRQATPQRLELTLLLEDAPLDHQLEHAMREDLHRVWDELTPTGFVTVLGKIVWIPERNLVDVEFPSIRVRDGSLMLKDFRYPLDHVEALLAYSDGRVEIKEFSASHDETRINLRGEYQREPGQLWRLRLQDVTVDDLVLDRQMRKALPDAMREGVETFNPEGRMTLNADLIELRGSELEQSNVTAAWSLTNYVEGMNFNGGLEVTNARGSFTSRGTWDGKKVVAKGEIDLEYAICLEQELTKIHGPFSVNDDVITIGSGDDLLDGTRDSGSGDHLTARVLGDGVLTVDSRVVVGNERRDVYGRITGEPTRYRVHAELAGGHLEEFTRRNGSGGVNLRGIMNGEINLQGSGEDTATLEGNGKLLIRPAALYELPVVLQIFQRMNVVAPLDNRAFDEALLEFKIGGKHFNFSRIDLLGNSLSLRGRGTLRFDGKLNLEFYSTNPKSQLAIPVVREFINGVSYGMVAVDVSGWINDPQTNVKTNFIIDNALRNFLGGFQPLAPVLPNRERNPNQSSRTPGFFKR